MRNVVIKEYLEYNEDDILDIYKSVGWSNYYKKPEMLRQAYRHSLCVFGAYVNDKLIGMIRVVGDGHSIIYIQDIIVMPNYQRQGIGRLLMNEVLEKYKNVYQKVLLTDNQPNTIRFYENMGFSTSDKFGCVSFLNYTL